MPLLLQIDPNLDLTFLRDKVSFEIVAEQSDGYVIVATEDIDRATIHVERDNDFVLYDLLTGQPLGGPPAPS